jgi:two-component system chemotaxis response regulator CheB
MYINYGRQISLSTEPSVNHSRPSIDLSFFSAADSYRNKLLGIILSGANKDGAMGLKKVVDLGGTAIVQDPNEAQITTMPNSALELIKTNYIYNTEQIIKFLKNLVEK